MYDMNFLISYLQSHQIIVVMAVVIIFDLFMGVLRSVKEKKTNSSIGIDGMLRKVGMIGCLSFLVLLDFFMRINIIGWLPEQVLNIFKTFGIENVGVSDVFALLFIVFELLSVIKNWTLLGLPMFKGVNEWIINFLETFTDEMPTTNKNK